MSLLKQSEVIATRITHSGAWEISAIVNRVRYSNVFYGYTKREAIRIFVNEINSASVTRFTAHSAN